MKNTDNYSVTLQHKIATDEKYYFLQSFIYYVIKTSLISFQSYNTYFPILSGTNQKLCNTVLLVMTNRACLTHYCVVIGMSHSFVSALTKTMNTAKVILYCQ